MALTEDMFKEFKKDYLVHRKGVVEDQYKHKSASYSDDNTYILPNVMFTPITDQAVVELYGIKVTSMKQCVLYGDTDVNYGDRVNIDDQLYEVVRIMLFNTHRVIIVERV